MGKEKESSGKKNMTLAEARTRMKEHALTPRIEGKQQAQAVPSREHRKPEGPKGDR
jgi:hypothetical protein